MKILKELHKQTKYQQEVQELVEYGLTDPWKDFEFLTEAVDPEADAFLDEELKFFDRNVDVK